MLKRVNQPQAARTRINRIIIRLMRSSHKLVYARLRIETECSVRAAIYYAANTLRAG